MITMLLLLLLLQIYNFIVIVFYINILRYQNIFFWKLKKYYNIKKILKKYLKKQLSAFQLKDALFVKQHHFD